MHLALGPLQVTIKYTYPRGKTTIYQRAVPTDLRDRYPGATIKQDLKTSDPVKVARMVAKLNAKFEAEWDGLRAAPGSSPESLKAHAQEFLRQWGLTPGAPDNHPMAIELLHDHMDRKRQAFAGADEERYRSAGSEEYMTPVEVEAGRLLHGTRGDTLTDALEVYLAAHTKRNDTKFTTYTRRAFGCLVAVTGDKEVTAFTRADAHRFVTAQLESGVKTGTVRRRVNVLRAVWTSYTDESAPRTKNHFERLSIPGEGEDKAERSSFTAAQLTTLYTACREADDDRRWLFALLIDTGARIGEMAGLTLDNLQLESPVPHVVIEKHPWRSLKTRNSARKVPLVGASLWAAKRIKETATEDQRFAFPRYTKERGGKVTCASDTASATLVGWLQPQGIDGVNHELRHTLADRLRAVQCPKPVLTAITGHSKQDVSDVYGSEGHPLAVIASWLSKIAMPDPT